MLRDHALGEDDTGSQQPFSRVVKNDVPKRFDHLGRDAAAGVAHADRGVRTAVADVRARTLPPPGVASIAFETRLMSASRGGRGSACAFVETPSISKPRPRP